MLTTFPFLLVLCLWCTGISHCQRRSIKHMPRVNFQPNFNQYSGYLTSTHGRRLFYWLVESSQVKPADAPLVLWLNGGPGCSSVGGLLMTNGPFLANDRAHLDRNDLAWNRLANMLYIDSPNGVGLSEPGPIDNSVLNDRFTTELNLGALVHFFSLFPEYQGRPFYITGESYAGIYIPLLAHAIQHSKHFPNQINLRGIAVGNGLHVDYRTTNQTQIEFLEVMGIRFAGIDVLHVEQDNTTLEVNPYNIAKPCHSSESNQSYPCLNSTGLVAYLNIKEVRIALGIDESVYKGRLDLGTNKSHLHNWSYVQHQYVICGLEIFNEYNKFDRNVLPELMALANYNISVLLYHGTLDYVIPVKVTQKLLEQLPQSSDRLPDKSDGAWLYCLRESGRSSLQIGGLEKSFMRGMIRFRTVIGAGHSVPTDRPDMGFQIFADFLGHGDNSQHLHCEEIPNSAGASSHSLCAFLMTFALLTYL